MYSMYFRVGLVIAPVVQCFDRNDNATPHFLPNLAASSDGSATRPVTVAITTAPELSDFGTYASRLF